ncbi:pentapeptide repeat-containing protein [Saccharothrix syringae]|uniref:pentapeptide repeat-containing protein n=1 Tax=Saccharothrix syringae TaxID=103733 RepID=UPI001D174A3D|nr:pentapeptide repeat-containing protein [Saccharothrix syringae]
MGYLWIAGAVVVVVAALLLLWQHRRRKSLLGPTLIGSIGAFLLVAGWLFAVDPGAPEHEAIKTGGLAGGSVVALYALWLNDRRRQVDDARHVLEGARQDLETARAEHDRSRVADERFARSVELLGHDAEQVRVGAMHALAGLARSRAEYTQTVLDVLCAYLRRPFRVDDGTTAGARGPDEREFEVRLTAQRLIADLLPRDDAPGAPRYDLDLTRAYLEYFDISHRQVNDLLLRAARLHQSNSFHHTTVHGGAWFTDARSPGRLYLHDMTFHDKGWFSRFTARGRTDLSRTRFLGPNKFAEATFTGFTTFEGTEFARPVDFRHVRFTGGVDLRLAGPPDALLTGAQVSVGHGNLLPDGWVVDPRGLVRN